MFPVNRVGGDSFRESGRPICCEMLRFQMLGDGISKRLANRYRVQFATVAALVALVAIPVAARSAETPPGQESSKPASAQADNTKSAAKAPGVRDHQQLQPVASDQFKVAAKPSKKSSAPGVRDHLSLRPLTTDDFKAGGKIDRKAVTPSPPAK